MTDLYKNKYRISSARLQTWDYKNSGMYFVTICTKNREYFFGNLVRQRMQLTEIGRIAEKEWFKTPGLRPDMNLKLGEFVVMPNHIHGIIIIGENEYNTLTCGDINNIPKNQFAPQSKNLASIIRGYKSTVTTYARKNNIPFSWQPRFHDHIIRSMGSYRRISRYIINNPRNWRIDRFKDSGK